MTFPSRWEQFLHDYEFEDARRIYTNGSRLIPSFRVKQMMEHYAPSVEQAGWFAQVRWCAEDVIAAAEQNGITLNPGAGREVAGKERALVQRDAHRVRQRSAGLCQQGKF